jgi:hypothetical protein
MRFVDERGRGPVGLILLYALAGLAMWAGAIGGVLKAVAG